MPGWSFDYRLTWTGQHRAMISRAFAFAALLLAGAPAPAQPTSPPVLKVDSAIFLDDVVVVARPVAAARTALPITEPISSPPAALADVTAGLVSGTTADAATRQIDAELDRATRAVRYTR